MKQFEKKYQVWSTQDGVAYMPVDYETLEECIMASKSDPYYITKRVLLNVTDAEEQLPVITSVPIYDSTLPPAEVRSDEESDVLDRYLGGGDGTVTLS